MANPLADPDEIAEYWRPLTAAETVTALALISVASALIRRRIPDVDARVADGTLEQSILGYVIAEMIKAAVEAGSRPVDAKSASETAGPYTRAVTYGAAAKLAVTEDLVALLGGESSTQIGSIQLGPPLIPAWPCRR